MYQAKLDPLRRQPTEDHQDVSRRETYYQLCMHTHGAVLAFATLKARVKIVSKQFDEDYDHVTHCSQVENRLASGLLKLRNTIWNPNFSYTRDDSLKVILELLKEDDEVFPASELLRRHRVSDQAGYSRPSR